ncbi:MAG: hypothetical protein AUI14_14290 [Actinobacteria bacterium 13_2_20CM_2_71_6]|nr:MAG: hypothetical protein AUI14_14290 [Actinobacteria bacterium 13_2_20CM_2_71_6]
MTFDAATSRAPGWQAAQRVQYVVAQVAVACAGHPKSEVAEVLAQRLNGIGVNPTRREIERYAQAIAELPGP